MRRQRILIFRPDNIGDVVLFSGALRHIRRLYPDAHLTLAVQSHIVNLVELCPHVDACVSVNALTWWSKFEAIPFAPRFVKIILAINRAWNTISKPFDLVLYPVKSPKTKHLKIISVLNVKEVVGIVGCHVNAPPGGYPQRLLPDKLFSRTLDLSGCEAWRHEMLTTLDYLRYLGCDILSVDDIRPEFWLSDIEHNCLEGAVENGRRVIGVFPGASTSLRTWDAENYGEVAKLIAGDYCYAIFGSQSELELSEQVVSSIKREDKNACIINFTGKTSLRELMRGISACDLLISMETSGLHMAIAGRVPTVAIVGGGHFGRFVPWGAEGNVIFLSKKLDCYYCNWLCSKGWAECIQGVTPWQVAVAAKSLLS